jgi:hypothetical protein
MRKFAFGAAALLAAGSASAAIDVTGVTTAIGDSATPIGTVAVAVLVVLAAVKAYKLIRRAM